MFKRSLTKSALVGGATVAGVGILAAAAFAAVPTYHISAGAKKSGTVNYTATAAGTPASRPCSSPTPRRSTQLTCASATAAGVMKLGAVSGTKAATITKTTWTTCKGLGLTLMPTRWAPGTSTATAPTTSGGVTTVHISNIKAHITSSVGCTLDVTGNADGTYTN